MKPKIDLPNVTIVIPNHNYGHWISEAIHSVAEQDYPNKMIAVVDDASMNNSWNVISLLANLNIQHTENLEAVGQIALVKPKNTAYTGMVKNVPLVAYRFEQAGGPSRARNLGMKLTWDHT